jgi:hypothetical protein
LPLLAEWLFDGVEDRSSSRWQDKPIEAAQHIRNIADVIKQLDVDILGMFNAPHTLSRRLNNGSRHLRNLRTAFFGSL